MHHAPPQMLNSYLIKGERPTLSLCLFYEPHTWYIANKSRFAKETVSPKIGKNIEMLVCFICIGNEQLFKVGMRKHLVHLIFWFLTEKCRKMMVNTA